MSASWIEYTSDFGIKFTPYIDNYGKFHWEGIFSQVFEYANRGASILVQEIRNRYPIFRGSLSFLNNGYKFSHRTLEIFIRVGLVNNDYLISVSIFINKEEWKYAVLNIPDTLQDYRKDSPLFYEQIMSDINSIPFIEEASLLEELRVNIDKLNMYLPVELRSDAPQDILDIVKVSLSISYTIDSL